jgi:hypothetical protein
MAQRRRTDTAVAELSASVNGESTGTVNACAARRGERIPPEDE